MNKFWALLYTADHGEVYLSPAPHKLVMCPVLLPNPIQHEIQYFYFSKKLDVIILLYHLVMYSFKIGKNYKTIQLHTFRADFGSLV